MDGNGQTKAELSTVFVLCARCTKAPNRRCEMFECIVNAKYGEWAKLLMFQYVGKSIEKNETIAKSGHRTVCGSRFDKTVTYTYELAEVASE